MAIDSKHPLYAELAPDWETMRDFHAGEDKVKERGQKYLPATAGMHLDGMKNTTDIGFIDYEAYKKRAQVPDYVEVAVEVLLGLLHQKEPTIELPTQLEGLRDKATVNGESLNTLLRRINVEQLITGRLGLLADFPEVVVQGKETLPYIALYTAEACINWDDNSEEAGYNALNLVVLDESQFLRIDFEWKTSRRFRVLQLGELAANEQDDAPGVVYTQHLFTTESGEPSYDPALMVAPRYKGKTLGMIPFVFINSKDILATPDRPPLKPLANLCECIYRGEADYRQNLHMQAQDTLVVIGGVKSNSTLPGQPDTLRTGAGARIDVDVEGDAKYIGVSADGLQEQRIALENDRQRASVKAGELIQSGGSQQESGEALRTRFTAQTATLNQIALSSAGGLENILKTIAVWVGANPDEVKITPNMEFTDFGLDGLNFVNILQAKKLGMPISYESIHAIMADRGMTVYDFKTEIGIIQKENTAVQDIVALPAPDPAPDQPSGGKTPTAKNTPTQKVPAQKGQKQV